MAIFSKGGSSTDGFKRSDRKAEAFFRHAETYADSRNYDAAISMYVDGLRHAPDNMEKHEELREVAMRRKVGGGKKPGMFGVKSVGDAPADKMLTAEKTASMDPTNPGLYVKVMEEAIAADRQEEEVNLGEVGYWAGNIAMEMMGQIKDPKQWIKLRDNFAALQQFDKAVECCKRAISLKPGDSNLMGELKELEAERYSHKSSEGSAEGGGFRGNLKDSDEQELARVAAGGGDAGDAFSRLVAARRAEWEEEPEDTDKLVKLVEALLKKEEDEPEREAIGLLKKAAEETGQYRYRVRAGDVQMRQINRHIRFLRNKMKKEGVDEESKAKLEQIMRQKLAFELKEYGDRVDHYPTDLGLKFELGKRQFLTKQFDDAISNFQQAKADPKNRAQSHYYLGKAYLHKEWSDEAVETLEEGIENYPHTDDALGKEMRYDLMLAYADAAEKNKNLEMSKKAERLGSELLRSDINFKDIRAQRDRLRDLSAKLSGGGEPSKSDDASTGGSE